MVGGEEMQGLAVYAILALAIWSFVGKRQISVRKLCYFPIVQCRPIQTFRLQVTPKAFGLNWQWAVFTETGTLADLSEFPFLADIQSLFHYNYSDFPTAMELRFGTRGLTFELSTPTGPGTTCGREGLKGRYWAESQQVTEWLDSLFGVELTLGRVEWEESPLVHIACISSWDTEKQRANLILDSEDLSDSVQVDSVQLRRKAGGYKAETAGCVQQISTCWV